MMRHFLFLLGGLPGLLLMLSCSRPLPPPAKPPVAVVSRPGSCNLNWEAGLRTLPAQRIRPAPAEQWQFRGQFTGAASERFFWDARQPADLRRMKSLRFQIKCSQPGLLSRGFFYFKSGAGWYGATFAPKTAGTWEEVELVKAETFLEGSPAGWKAVSCFRLALTGNGTPGTVTLDIRSMEPVAAPGRLAVVRGLSAFGNVGKNENRGISDYPARMMKALTLAGPDPLLLDDLDVTDGYLDQIGTQLVLLPYHPQMPDAVTQALLRYLNRGGFVIGFFIPAPALAQALGFTAGKFLPATAIAGGYGGIRFRENGIRLAPAFVPQASWIIQELQPRDRSCQVVATWTNAAGTDTGAAAVLHGPKGAWMSHVYLNSEPQSGSRMLLALTGQFLPDLWREAATTTVARLARETAAAGEQVRRLHQEARQHLAARDYPGALKKAQLCRNELERQQAAASLGPAANEFRGAWCHRGYGILGWSWDRSVQHLKACGFNNLLVNMTWAGRAYYPSQFVPSDPVAKRNGDQLRQCADACARYGINLHVWMVCFNLGEAPVSTFADELRRAGRLQIDFNGKTNPLWLCPNHPENRRLELNQVREILNYPVTGIHLDYIRYPDREHCFCETCRHAFESWAKVKVRNWPADLRRSNLENRWSAFRQGAITGMVREIRAEIRRRKPEVKLSAAVFDQAASCGDTVGQDWPGWCRQGLVDFVAPMNYTADLRQFSSLVQAQVGVVKGTDTRIYPGIGVRTAGLNLLQTARQIALTRHYGTGGFVLFEFNQDEATGVFTGLGEALQPGGAGK